ncbi:TetR/AcrR family transcriptional regulator, partial [Streptomyces sp. ISL-66]|nr:TetR/AcrR family transcriptional regulator [Streptomyces sp. ISL-66]
PGRLRRAAAAGGRLRGPDLRGGPGGCGGPGAGYSWQYAADRASPSITAEFEAVTALVIRGLRA